LPLSKTLHAVVCLNIIGYNFTFLESNLCRFPSFLPTWFLWSEKERGLTCEPMEIRTLTGGKSGQCLFVRSVSKAIKVRKNSSQRFKCLPFKVPQRETHL